MCVTQFCKPKATYRGLHKFAGKMNAKVTNITLTASREDDSIMWSDEDEAIWSEMPLEYKEDESGGIGATQEESNTTVTKTDRRCPPLELFHKRYLWVSDVMKQLWCEQQLHYSFTLPMDIQVVEKPEMSKGTDMHLARELEVQESVPVKITSDVDIFCIKLFNLHSAISAFLTGVPVRREIPIFGTPLNCDTFMTGIIDEIRVDPETFTWEIVELKTRRHKTLPSKAQKQTHELQVMLYKTLFDNLVSGKTTQELIEHHLGLDFEKELGQDVVMHLKSVGLNCTTLSGVWKVLKDTLGAVPQISQLFIEYCWQEDQSTIAIESVEYNESWLTLQLDRCLEYWKGEREVCGVDIEDAWKCQTCDFVDVCEWRAKKAEEHRIKNIANFHKEK